MSATFNSTGTKILGLRKRLPPVLYDVSSPVKVSGQKCIAVVIF